MSLVMSQTRSSEIANGDRKPPTGPLRALQSAPRGMIKFPTNIETVGHFMKISVFEKHKFEAELDSSPESSSLKERTDIIRSMLLPMPSGLATTYAQNYDDSQALGPIGAAVGAAASDVGFDRMNSTMKNLMSDNEALNKRGAEQLKSIGGGVVGNVMQELKQGGGMNLALQFAESNAAAAVGGAVDGPLGALAGDQLTKSIIAGAAGAGVARNPHMAVIYKTPNFRKFNFSWELRPRSFMESQAIQRMIHTFKYYSAPSFLAKSHMFKYPNQFGLSFKYNDFLFTMGTSVLTNFTVDYHGEGTPLYYEASERSSVRTFKPPAVVKLSTEFQEISILTKEGIEKRGR